MDASKAVEIPLTQGYVALVDAIDADLKQYKWHCELSVIQTVYANGPQGRMHRIVLGRALNRLLLSAEEVDHISGDTLDNRRANLRVATRKENARNTKRRKDNTSGYKGVWLHKSTQTWRACIKVEGRTLHLGVFDTPEMAHEAYCVAARHYFGEFARLK